MSGIRKSVTSFPRQFSAGRQRQAALARFATAMHVVSFLSKLSTAHEERNRVLTAIVEEHRSGKAHVWQAMLVTIFSPLLFTVRNAFEDPDDEDLNQMILLAFLEAISSPYYNPNVPVISIQMRMFKALTRFLSRDHTSKRPMPAEETLLGKTYTIKGNLEMRDAMAMLSTVTAGDQRIADVMRATVFDGEPLADYVKRLHPTLDEKAREALAERLDRERTVVVARLNARLSGATIVPTRTPS
jgi:hypothetical protein